MKQLNLFELKLFELEVSWRRPQNSTYSWVLTETIIPNLFFAKRELVNDGLIDSMFATCDEYGAYHILFAEEINF